MNRKYVMTQFSLQRAGRGSLLSLLALACAAQAAGPGDAYALGDWNGERSRLAAEGIVFDLEYGSEVAHNLTGGARHMTSNTGQLSLDSAFDLDKLWGWRGASFRFTISDRSGNNLNTAAGINALMQPQEVWGRNQTWRLTQLWYGQDLLDKKLQVKLGRLAVGEDFSTFDCGFMSLAFCGDQSGNLVGNYWYNYPVSQWGALAKVNLNAQIYVKAGVYQVNPAYLETRHALSLNPGGTTGALFPVEAGWTPSFGDHLQGHYVAGGWYTNSAHPDVYTDVDGNPAGLSGQPFAQRDGAYGGYLTFVQQFTRGDRSRIDSGLRGFVNVTQADRKTSQVDREIAVGAVYGGPFAARPQDDVGLAFASTHANSRASAYRGQFDEGASAAAYLPARGSETTVELYYAWTPLRWLTVRPDLQMIHHAGGVGGANVYVVGAKSAITF